MSTEESWTDRYYREEAERRQKWEEGKADTFQKIRDRGAVKAVLTFSGGHDEGGVDNCLLLDDNENLVVELTPMYGDKVHFFDKAEGKYKSREATEEEKANSELFHDLEVPVDIEYGSFAGEFSVTGNVVWDTTEETILMDGTEYVEQGHGVTKEF